MTLDIERIKSTALGRAWLSRFVELVWAEVLTPTQQRRLNSAERVGARMVIDSHRGPAATIGHDLAILDMEAAEIIEVDWRRFKRLTPLGVEVYLYGREQAGKRGGR